MQVVAETIKSCLDDLPGFPRTQIGFITYDSTIHFYNMKASNLDNLKIVFFFFMYFCHFFFQFQTSYHAK